MQTNNIIDKARQLGLDTGHSDNQADNLRLIAEQVGINDFDSINDVDKLEAALNERLNSQNSQSGNIDSNSGEIETLDGNEQPEALDNGNNIQNQNQQRQRFGEKEYNAAKDENGKYNKDYYKSRKQELEQKVANAKVEKSRNWKKNPNDNGPVKADGSNTQRKNWRDKFQDNVNLKNSKRELRQAKRDEAKAKTHQILHPFRTLKDKAKTNAKDFFKNIGKKILNGLKNLIMRHPLIAFIVIFFIFILFIVLFFFFGGAGSSSNNGSSNNGAMGYYEPSCNYNDATVNFSACNSSSSENISLEDYVIRTTYAYTQDRYYNEEAIRAFMIVIKTNALSRGGYNNSTKTIELNDCEVKYSQTYEIPDVFINDYKNIYNEISNYLYLSNLYTSTITSLSDSDLLNFDDNTLDTFQGNNNLYEKILSDYYGGGFKVYNLGDYCTYYNITENDAYWWPIGSSSPSSGNIYDGTPIETRIASYFGPRDIDVPGASKNHGGIDIAPITYNACSDVPIIATKSGTVNYTNDGCVEGDSECGGGLGNWVRIDHGNGIVTRYGHMSINTLAVKEGDVVKQGQILGRMGSTGTSSGCHLHFEIIINDNKLDPLGYVSMEYPRPTNSYNFNTSGDEGGKQNVCKALLASGLSKNAVVGMMINIERESDFKVNDLEGCYEENKCCPEIGENYGFCGHPEIAGFGSDEAYTSGVDSGAYPKSSFINDHAGYGLIQWTDSTRKEKLYDYVKNVNKSIGSLSAQLGYLYEEIQGYPITYKYITGNYSAYDIGYNFCIDFERPHDNETVCKNRVDNALDEYVKYVDNNCN